MGSCYSKKKKTTNKKQVEYSPQTAQDRYNARQNAKLIYPPLSSIPIDEPKRSLTADGRPLYQSVQTDAPIDDSPSNYRRTETSRISSNFPHHYHQYNDGTFAVLSRYPMNDSNVFRL